MKYRLAAVLLILGPMLAAGADLTGSQVLDRMKAVTVADDRIMEAEMTITDRNDRVQTCTIKSVMKGDNKIMVTFVQPAELAGVTFMSTSKDNMWIYLPTQGRVRRISGSMVNQGFGGSDFSYDEMADISFTGDDDVAAIADDTVDGTDAYKLTMEEDDGSTFVWVERARFLPLQVEKHDAEGSVVKRVNFSGFAHQDELWVPGRIVMHDLNKGSRTEIRVKEFELNAGIRDNEFTEANMKRGA